MQRLDFTRRSFVKMLQNAKIRLYKKKFCENAKIKLYNEKFCENGTKCKD